MWGPGLIFSESDPAPEGALGEIAAVVTDCRARQMARQHAPRNARAYYIDGSRIRLNAEFFERILNRTAGGSSASGQAAL